MKKAIVVGLLILMLILL